MIIVLYVTDR